MSKYLKLFATTSAYEAYINGGGVILPNVSFCEDERGVYYNPVHDYTQDYFTMVITTGGDVTWTGTSGNELSYSIDNGTTWSAASSITLSVNAGDKILWKGITTPQLGSGIGKFSGDTNVRYTVEGNIMALLYGDDFKEQTSLEGKDYAFFYLFGGNPNVTSAENLSLPAITLANQFYRQMFQGCTSLTTAPELPATTLATNCYYSMFRGCTSLTTAPQLPATTLTSGCYSYMFNGCTSLTTAPELPATTLANNCYNNMFNGCTNLTTAPDLPATTLVDYCYSSMFKGCTSLNSIKCLATEIHIWSCTTNWVSGVAASGTFTKASSMSSWTEGTSGIPSGWTVVDA